MELYPEPNRMSQPSLAARKHLREQKYKYMLNTTLEFFIIFLFFYFTHNLEMIII